MISKFTFKTIKKLINIDSDCPESYNLSDDEMEFKNEPINSWAYKKPAYWLYFYTINFAWNTY